LRHSEITLNCSKLLWFFHFIFNWVILIFLLGFVEFRVFFFALRFWVTWIICILSNFSAVFLILMFCWILLRLCILIWLKSLWFTLNCYELLLLPWITLNYLKYIKLLHYSAAVERNINPSLYIANFTLGYDMISRSVMIKNKNNKRQIFKQINIKPLNLLKYLKTLLSGVNPIFWHYPSKKNYGKKSLNTAVIIQ
jgi:hypothetical protein